MQQALQAAGLVAKRRKRGPHRRRQPRPTMPGMLLHIDGMIVILDDATSEIYYASWWRKSPRGR